MHGSISASLNSVNEFRLRVTPYRWTPGTRVLTLNPNGGPGGGPVVIRVFGYDGATPTQFTSLVILQIEELSDGRFLVRLKNVPVSIRHVVGQWPFF